MSSALSACFLEGSPNIREAVRNAKASRIVCGRRGSNEDRRDVLTMSAGQCRQSAEGVPKCISASKFCSGPKSRRGKFALSRRRRNARKRSGAIKTVKGIFQEYADRFPNHGDLWILHSASCPGLVRALVDAWSHEFTTDLCGLLPIILGCFTGTGKSTGTKPHQNIIKHISCTYFVGCIAYVDQPA